MTDMFDQNADGFVDAVSWDQNADSVIDTVAVDLDQNGVFEAVGYDSNQDGVGEIFLVDTDQNGTFEGALFDQNGDGVIDAAATDTDNDGVLDSTWQVDENSIADANRSDAGIVGGPGSVPGLGEISVVGDGEVASGPGIIGPATNPDPVNTLLEKLAEETGQATFGTPDSDHDGWNDNEDAAPSDPFYR